MEVVLALAGRNVAALVGADLTPADMGKEAAIGLLRGFANKAALFEVGIQVHGAAIRAGTNTGSGGQVGERLQNFHHRLRRFQSAGIHFE